jgi:cytochrome c-type biogenesis protein CcmH
MVEKLAQRLEGRPEDLEGWAMLGRSYRVLGRNEDAARAYAKAESFIAGDPRMLVDYAESLALAHGGNLQGKPAELIARALELDPSFALARMLSGAAAFQREDYARAIRDWTEVQARFPPDSEEARGIGESIARARAELASRGAPQAKPEAGAPSTPAGGAKVAGTVRLADALAAKAAPTDAVFVFARAAAGGGPPLAVLRRQVKDLPLAFALDDSMAMSPERRLSGADEVVVGARISRSGSPLAQSGDLQGLSAPVKVGAAGVAVVIDTALP